IRFHPDSRFMCYVEIEYGEERLTPRAVTPVRVPAAFVPSRLRRCELIVFLCIVGAIVTGPSHPFAEHAHAGRQYDGITRDAYVRQNIAGTHVMSADAGWVHAGY